MLVNSPRFIPPLHRNRTLVLCFDGTADYSNVTEFFRLLKKDDHSEQIVYYQAGTKIHTGPSFVTPLITKLSKAMDHATAWNLDAHVMEGYSFIMENYTAGDCICIFGVARGAYLARGLAGMIHKVGVLPKGNHRRVPSAYKMYTRNDKKGWEQSSFFKKAFSIAVDIEFLGVWDTVPSVGVILKRLPFTASNTVVRTFRHAVSLDESRVKFRANLWNGRNNLGIKYRHFYHHDGKNWLKVLEKDFGIWDETDVQEVWFAGCHCDVAGGSATDYSKPNLARIPLRWMICKCFKANTGIMFYSDLLNDIGLDPSSLYPLVLLRPPLLPISNNNIQRIPSWILEFLPVRTRLRREDGTWISHFGWNLGRGRVIQVAKSAPTRLHRTIKMRLEARYADGLRYIPNAQLDESYTVWVD
ncbi:hypothetical protein GYMLUDRAFT_69801 [Collybiopsis luxurians FD-317 M1]|nr:hypothetical protein GYMLUDRAFT_69801 [Collybiopsis luxurians FD-317 M1]